MIHNDVLNQLQLLVKISAPPLVDVAETPLEEPQWVPGQRLSAVVLSSMPNGRFQVQVGDHVLDMNLPKNTQQGEQVELVYVSNQPRLTFVLTRDLAAAVANAAPANVNPQVTLSDSARFLGGLLQKIADHAGDPASALARAAPLISSAPSDIKEFSATLRNTLSQSGLFYESHQAQWVAGERKLADLLLEPQGRLSTNISTLEAASGNGARTASAILQPGNAVQAAVAEVGSRMMAPVASLSGGAAQAAAVDADAGPVPDASRLGGATQAAVPEADARTASRSSGAAQAAVAEANPRALSPQPDTALMSGAPKFPVHAETISLVHQQLQTLDSRQLAWQGQVWPGQAMEWRVEERAARDEGGGDVEMSHWQTSLRLQLPSMGNVQATLAIMPQGLRINLKAEAGVTEIMKGSLDRLLRSMESSGLNVLSISVDRHEKT
jgi:hypothetical protein